MSKHSIDHKLDRILNEVLFIKRRTSSYLGNNEALGYLVDETPIFVNTDDMGGPINVLNGGRYEEDYLGVLASYRQPRSTFLDIGANLGIYSLRMAPLMRSGRIVAFEPLRRVRDLFRRSVYLNNLAHVIDVRPFGLSDVSGEAYLTIPPHHAGGATLEGGTGGSEQVEVRTLDSLVDRDFVCDLVKLDVEGHEFRALRGMESVLRRSPHCVVLFEKLIKNGEYEHQIFEFAESLGWCIYVLDGIRLTKVTLDGFRESESYFIAGLPEVVESGGLVRNFLDVYPTDLNVIAGELKGDALEVEAMAGTGEIIFHGPYWYLPRGYYSLQFDGEIASRIQIDLTERFGYEVEQFHFDQKTTCVEFPVVRDLCQFELVCRAHRRTLGFTLRKLRLKRLA